MIVIDIFAAVEFTFYSSNHNFVTLFGFSSEMKIIPVVAASKLNNCILPIRLNPDRQKKRIVFSIVWPPANYIWICKKLTNQNLMVMSKWWYKYVLVSGKREGGRGERGRGGGGGGQSVTWIGGRVGALCK